MKGTAMDMQEVVEKFERVDDLFGDISSNLVYICEELPSLEIPKETEEHIVGFCCTFLERLVEEDKSIQRILSGVKGNVDRVPHVPCRAPTGAPAAMESTTRELGQNVQSMHTLITEYRSLAEHQPGFRLLSTLLNESGANIVKAYDGIREVLESVLSSWASEDLHD